MASLVFARRFSSNFRKYSSSSPLSYLTHTRDRFSVPKISNSFSSIFNRHCNSSAQYSKSPADSSLESLKPSSSHLVLDDRGIYFLARARHENSSNLCEKFLLNHKEYLDQLPKELDNITPEEFRRGIEILLNSMEGVRSVYSFHTSLWLLLMGYSMCSSGEVYILLGLNFGLYYDAKLKEVKSIEKVVLLLNLHKLGKISIQTAVLQLIKEVEKSNRLRVVVCSVYGCILFGMAVQTLVHAVYGVKMLVF